MATRATLFEVDINVEQLLKKTVEAKKKVDELKETQASYVTIIDITNKEIKENTDALETMAQQGKKNTEEYKALEAATKALALANEENRQKLELTNSELREANAEYRLAGRVVDDYNKSKNREKNIITETDGSISQLNRALSVNKKAYADLTQEERENEAIGGKLRDLINEQDEEYKKLQKSIGNNNVEVGNYRQQLEGMLVDIKNGASPVSVLTNGFKAMYAQMLALAMNPIGATLIALAGVAKLTKMWFDYNVEMSKSTRLVQQFTGLSGDALTSLTSKIRTLAEESGESEKAVINSVNATAEAWNLSYDDAFSKVQKGYIRVGDAAEDYFDNSSEYAVHFKNMGYSADEFFSIMEAGAEGGAYKDKLVDTVKEFSLRFNDLPKSARDAMNETFGNQFTNNLISQYEKGEIKGREVLDRLITQGNKLGLSYEDTGALVANVMGAMGEDAGGYEKVVQAINKGLSETDRELSEIEEARQIELESTQALEEKWASLFDQSGGTFEMLKAQGKAWLNGVLIKLIDGVIDFANGFIETYNNSLMLRAVIGSIGNSMSISVNVAMSALKLFWNGLKSTGKLISSILTFDLDGVKSAISEGWSGAVTIVKDASNTILSDINKTIDQIKNGKLNKIEFDTSNLTDSKGEEETKKGPGKVGADESDKDKKEREKAAKEAEKALQKEINDLIKQNELKLKLYLQDNQNINNSLAKKLEILKGAYEKELKILKLNLLAGKITQEQYNSDSNKLKVEYAQNQAKLTAENLSTELELYIAQNRSKIENDKALTNELVQGEKDRQKNIYTERLKILEQQKAGELISEQEFLIEKLNLQAEYLQQQKDLEDRYSNERIEKQKGVDDAQWEIKIADAANKFEQEKVIEDKRHEDAKKDLDDRLNKGLLTKIQYDKLTEQENTKHSETLKSIDKAVLDAKLNGYATVLGGIRDLFGQQSAVGKAAAIAETTINTYRAAQSAYSAMAGIPIVGPALGAAAAGIAVVSGLRNVQKITSTKTKFQDGGLIKGNSHSNGGVPFTVAGNGGFEAEGGEFIVNKKSTASYLHLLQAINESSGLNKPQPSAKFINGGIVTSKMSTTASLTNVNIDIDSMAQKIGEHVGEANKNIRPVVAVEDINHGQKNLADVVNGANL